LWQPLEGVKPTKDTSRSIRCEKHLEGKLPAMPIEKVYLIDTNVVLRFLLDDHASFSPKAKRFMQDVFNKDFSKLKAHTEIFSVFIHGKKQQGKGEEDHKIFFIVSTLWLPNVHEFSVHPEFKL
jgi:hypothetical protein